MAAKKIIKLIYVSNMFPLFTEEGVEFELNVLLPVLDIGHKVNIRQATPMEKSFFENELEMRGKHG